ncbi:SWIM zinc finger family protein [Simplicispira psychrophila]|uniref:SWIM zinc finger family protein n=1 Tax=Simplicispira psychrophila TaxID=80882 RepID=UPI000488885C|nr:SWIM zinc finger family protein [Simplicispira psychrophila]
MQFSAESVLALAPDAASAKAAQGLTKPGQWPILGASDAAVWGECQGSSRYQTQVDLSGPSFRCSCPSRKFPCKHGLALLLLWAKDRSSFQPSPSPAWVSEWLAARTERTQKKEEKQQQKAADKAADSNADAAAQKTAAKRWSRIDQGVAELQQWLSDQIDQGLGHLTQDSRAAWETMAARLVDAQAPGLAQRLRYAAEALLDGVDWPKNVLRRLGLLQLACDAVARRAALDEGASADMRALLSWPIDKDSILAQASPVSDEWLVLGVIQEERDNRLMERRVWLHGLQTGQRAFLLDHTFAGRVFESSWVALSTVQATLAFYPSAAPLRALVVSSQTLTLPSQQPAPPPSIPPLEEWQRVAQRVAANPWSHLHPLRCSDATLHYDGEQGQFRFHLQWGDMALPLQLHLSDGWALLALSGGQPLTVHGEWDGSSLRPLTAVGPEGFWTWTPRA